MRIIARSKALARKFFSLKIIAPEINEMMTELLLTSETITTYRIVDYPATICRIGLLCPTILGKIKKEDRPDKHKTNTDAVSHQHSKRKQRSIGIYRRGRGYDLHRPHQGLKGLLKTPQAERKGLEEILPPCT